MPRAAPKPCNHPGCNVLLFAGESYCQPHRKAKRKQSDAQRGSASARGYTGAWRKARYHYLMSHPLCRTCEQDGRLSEATVVDHIVPHRGDKDLFWDSSNWQPMCKHCHDVKTATEDGGFGKTDLPTGAG